MRLTTYLPPLLFTLILASLTSAASDFENAVTCGRRFPRISQAIEIFCNKHDAAGLPTNDLLVPSTYATNGVETTGMAGNKLKVWITGTCAPPQFVPAQWCRAQFFQMCATSSHPQGWSGYRFGKWNCQFWRINTRRDAPRQRPNNFKLVGS